jgi:Ser/Thr protein kinase RdoA (MazF antagonist)
VPHPAAGADLPARVTALLAQNRVGTVAKLALIFEERDKQVFRADLVDGRAVVVRVFPAARPIARVRGDVAVLAHAIAAGVPAERPVAALELDGRGVAVTEHLAGRTAERTADELRQLGEIAGRLAALAPVTGDEFLGRRAGSRPVDDLSYARADLDRVRAAVPPDAQAQLAQLDAAVAATRDASDLPHALVHPDFLVSNAICDAGGRLAVIDWEGAGVGPRLLPFCVLVFNAAVRCVDQPCPPSAPCRLELDRVAPIVDGLVRHCEADAGELDALADLIRVRPLAIAVRRFARAVEDGRLEPAWGWWSHHVEADAVAERVRAELARRA